MTGPSCEPGRTEQSNSTARVQKHRKALRAAGLGPIQIWVPESRARRLFGFRLTAMSPLGTGRGPLQFSEQQLYGLFLYFLSVYSALQ